MQKDNFYLTLLSNASFEEFSDNKTSDFTVKLPQTINLDGQYEVALCEMSYPMTIENVTKDNNQFIIELQAADAKGTPLDDKVYPVVLKIHEGYYRSIDDILIFLNNAIRNSTPHSDKWLEKDRETFKWNKQHRRIQCIQKNIKEVAENNKLFVVIDRNKSTNSVNMDLPVVIKRAYLHGRLALQLGYQPGSCVFDGADHCPSLSFGICENFLVYTDVIEPQIVGNVHGQIIKVVQAVDSHFEYGDSCVRNFTNRSYYSVLKKSFETLSISIRDTTSGELVSFGFGCSYVLLHFRRVTKKEQ